MSGNGSGPRFPFQVWEARSPMVAGQLPELTTPEKFAPNLHLTFSGVCLNDIEYLVERETGFEPATSTLARLHSTTELFPQHRNIYYTCGEAVNLLVRAGVGSPAHAKPMESPRLTVPPLITVVKTPCSGMMHSPILL
jgi:hypothetical protein